MVLLCDFMYINIITLKIYLIPWYLYTMHGGAGNHIHIPYCTYEHRHDISLTHIMGEQLSLGNIYH